jgi:hypothetical protein
MSSTTETKKGKAMAAQDDSPRRALVDALMDKIEADPYPSSTMLDVLESILRPDEVNAYAEVLLSHIRQDTFPSLTLINRVQALS